MSSLIAEALERNPYLQAARYDAQAAEERIAMAGALPAPELSAGFDDQPFRQPVPFTTRAMTEYTLQQRFPWPGKIGARMEAERQGFNATYARREDLERVMAGDVKQGYVQLWYLQNRMEVNMEIQQLLGDFVASARRLLEVGAASMEGIFSTEAEFARRRTEQRLIENEYARTLAAFNNLLNRHPQEPLGFIETLSPEVRLLLAPESLEQAYLHLRPDIRALQYGIQLEQALIDVARRDFYPDLQVEFKSMHSGVTPQRYAAMIGIQLPLLPWSREGVARRVSEAEYRRLSAERSFEASAESARAALHQALLDVDGAFDRLTLYQEEVIPRALLAIRTAEASFRTQQSDYLGVLDTYRTLEALRLEHLTARADYHTAVAELERQLGVDLSELVEVNP